MDNLKELYNRNRDWQFDAGAALPVKPPLHISAELRHRYYQLLTDEAKEFYESSDRANALDLTADLIIYAMSFAAECGFSANQLTEAMQRAIAANEAKRFSDGTYHRNEYGKIIKPEGWQAPDLSDLFDN